jgi:uncharacterized protein (TIRG00374 family)
VKKQLFKTGKKFLPLIGIIILIFLVYRLGVEEIKNAFLRINPIYILIAISLTLPRILIRNYAWQMIQKEQKIKLSFWQSLKIFLIGYFYGSFTPGYFGQFMRAPYMKEKTGEPYGKLFVNVFMEILLHTLSLWGMIVVGALIIVAEKNQPIVLYFAILYILILGILIVYFTKKQRGENAFSKLVKIFIPKKLRQYFYDFIATFYNDFPTFKRLIIPFLISATTWIIIFAQEYIFVIALDLPIPFLVFLFIFPIANFMGFIPITFAGLGIRDLTAVGLFTFMYPEIAGSDFLVVSLMGFIITDVVTGFIGFLLSLTETRDKSYKKFLKT